MYEAKTSFLNYQFQYIPIISLPAVIDQDVQTYYHFLYPLNTFLNTNMVGNVLYLSKYAKLLVSLNYDIL